MTTSRRSRVWFITGTDRAFAEAALERGDRVAAATPSPHTLDELAARHEGRLIVLPLDVRDHWAVFATVLAAFDHFGRLDVIVNNPGSTSSGMIEECTEAAARAQFELGFFGSLWVSQAALPQLREQGGGQIVQISSDAALGGLPGAGLHCASARALEGMSEALAQEAAGFGVEVSILRPASGSEPRQLAAELLKLVESTKAPLATGAAA